MQSTGTNSLLYLLMTTGGMAGLINVTLPASATVFLNHPSFEFSKTIYGSLFVWCLSAAVVASWFYHSLAVRFSADVVLKLGMFLYAAGSFSFPSGLLFDGDRTLCYIMTSLSVTLVGIGFGLTLSALNDLVVRQSRRSPESSLTLLHAIITCGAAAAPLVVGLCIDRNMWQAAPLVEGLVMCGLLALVQLKSRSTAHLTDSHDAAPVEGTGDVGQIEIMFLVLACLYGLCESAVSNWSGVILQSEFDIPASEATVVLSLFWGGVAVGRYLFSMFAGSQRTQLLWYVSPVCVVLSLIAIGWGNSAGVVVIAVAVAGLAMSYYYPLTLAIAGRQLPNSRTRLSGTSVATLLSGAGSSAIFVGTVSDSGGFDVSTIVGCFAVVALAAVVIQSGIQR